MNKVELVSILSDKTGIAKKDCEKLIAAFTETVVSTLISGGKVSISGFGSFETRDRAQKEAYNPVTKSKITVAAKKVPAFKPAKALKDTISQG